MNDPIDRLRAARPAHLGDDSPVDERARTAELTRAMAQPRDARQVRRTRGRRTITRPAWGLGLAGVVAAVTAVAVTVTGTGGTAPPPSAARTGQAASSPDSSRSSPGDGQVRLSARTVLLAAAHRAARRPDGTGAWWHTVSVRRTLFRAEGADYTVADRQRTESWTPSATGPEQRQHSSSQSLGARPATPGDEAAWREAGSPAEIPVVVPGKKGAKLSLPTEPGTVQKGPGSALPDGDKVFWLGRNVSVRDLRALPSEPDALRAWLLRSYKGHGTESSSTPMSRDAWLFTVTTGLIADMPVTPEVRGAAFRMLAGLASIEVARDVVDTEGRAGTAVTIDEPEASAMGKAAAGDDGILRTRLVFDERTGQALATERVVVRPGGLQAGTDPGTVWNSDVVLESGWTDDGPAS
ncbi:CU044_5270 family protein [Streptosporangium sp. NPDC048047]|uniref:CU044_5270 family protein n=1 Tax=Streptosporangium sp. NPDC048047 TaxID=3155748 RepID=UPI003429A453